MVASPSVVDHQTAPPPRLQEVVYFSLISPWPPGVTLAGTLIKDGEAQALGCPMSLAFEQLYFSAPELFNSHTAYLIECNMDLFSNLGIFLLVTCRVWLKSRQTLDMHVHGSGELESWAQKCESFHF